MHGISPQQFAETVASFLVPYYLALAAMNGIAAYYMWQKAEPVTVLSRSRCRASRSRSPTRCCGRSSRSCYVFLASLAASGEPRARCRRCRRRFATSSTPAPGRSIYSRRHDGRAGRAVRVPRVVREADGGLDDLEPDAAVPRPVDARPELLRDRRQAGQRADRRAGVPAGVLHLAGDVPRGGKRSPHGTKACRRSRSSTTKKCSCGRTWSTPR